MSNIEVFDKYGRPFTIPRDQYRSSVLPAALRSNWDDPDALCKALQNHVKEQIGVWKYPRWIEFRDSLPKTATGKIQRYKLRDEEGRGP